MRAQAVASLLVVLSLLGAGCLAGDPAGTATTADAPEAKPRGRPTVVGLIDSGINPYHVAFRAAPGEGVERIAAEVGAQVVRLSMDGDFQMRLEADAAFWEGVEPGRLYAFEGTRVLAMSASQTPGRALILESFAHGTGVASLVTREDPDAFVVMIQADADGCSAMEPEPGCHMVDAAEPMRWLAEQPWVDVISLSLSYAGNPPYRPEAEPTVAPFVEASRLANDNGKIVVVAAGNYLVPSLGSQFAGPPWVVAVGGAHASQRSEAMESSRVVDVVANYSAYAPRRASVDGYGWTLGTSFAAPLVAGTTARALSLLRAQGAPAPTPAELRAALNATAAQFGPADFDPTQRPTNDTLYNAVTHGVPVVVPFAQMGWGLVHGGMAQEIARRVAEGDLAPPAEKETTAQHQARWQALREAYWA